VGVVVVAQQTPLAVIAPPPSEDIVPPEVAEVRSIKLISVVVKVDKVTGEVVRVTSFPYAVPSLLVA
jgi:hypothetical protein